MKTPIENPQTPTNVPTQKPPPSPPATHRTKPPFQGGVRGVALFIIYSFFFILYSLIIEITETVGLKNSE